MCGERSSNVHKPMKEARQMESKNFRFTKDDGEDEGTSTATKHDSMLQSFTSF